MALNFPSSPNTNATYSFSGKTWTYNGNAWALTTETLSTSIVPEGTNLYFSNVRATTAVTNTSLSNITLSGNVNGTSALFTGNFTAGNIAPSGVISFSDGTSQSTAAVSSSGFLNSTTSTFPGSAGNVDYGDLTATTDSFGVSTSTAYTLMEPVGRSVTADLGTL